MKLFREHRYLQNGFKIWGDTFLFVGRWYRQDTFTFGMKVGSKHDDPDYPHFCSREVMLYFWKYKVSFWLEGIL